MPPHRLRPIHRAWNGSAAAPPNWSSSTPPSRRLQVLDYEVTRISPVGPSPPWRWPVTLDRLSKAAGHGQRGASANTSARAYKGSTLTALWRRNTTPGTGRRVVLPTRNDVHYIALTAEAIPVGGTPPTSTTLWEQTRPDPAGPMFLTVPANDRRRPPDPGDDVIIDMSSTDTGADRFVRIWQEIPAVALRGRTLRAGIRMESLGSPWAGVQLQVSQLNVNTKIKGHFGMGASRSSAPAASCTSTRSATPRGWSPPTGSRWIPPAPGCSTASTCTAVATTSPRRSPCAMLS
ncbi:MAG: hypothetical protein EOP38_26230 [Rubrivivax sp.]|nr:MAG: hypothetical protein EOP38_26230 [Rubrivivax sp.]